MSVDSLNNQAFGSVNFPSISADGRIIAFRSKALNLVANNTSDWDDVVHERDTTAPNVARVVPTEEATSVTLQARLNPYGDTEKLLAKNTRYKAVVRVGALDVFGNPLDQNSIVSGNQPKVWFFETRG